MGILSIISSVSGIIASGASAFDTWIKGKQQSKDQSDGATIQRESDQTAVLTQAAAVQQNRADLDQMSTDDLRKEALTTASKS